MTIESDNDLKREVEFSLIEFDKIRYYLVVFDENYKIIERSKKVELSEAVELLAIVEAETPGHVYPVGSSFYIMTA